MKAMLEKGRLFICPGNTNNETRACSISRTISTALGGRGTRNALCRCLRSFRLASGTIQRALSRSI